jgi:hypothetical protein
MRVRDIIPIWRLERLRARWKADRNLHAWTIDIDQPTTYDELLRELTILPEDWHGAGVCGLPPLRAIALYAQKRQIVYSAETGVGKSTLLLSHISQHHTAFALDDTGTSNSLINVRDSPLLRRDCVNFIIGPTQQTLPRYSFTNRLQMVLIDGPHGYPFPEIEYYFFYPQLDEDGLLIIDDIHIPTVFRLFSFLREEKMFDFLGVASTTAFFRRNSSAPFDPLGDGWWMQNYNRKRFPISDFDQDFVSANVPTSVEFKNLMVHSGHQPQDRASNAK